MLAPETYSLTAWGEADQVAAGWDRLLAQATALREQLPAESRDAYYQLVLHPIEASANLNRLYYTVARNRLYALQNRASTNLLADSARLLFDKDAVITRYFNTQLALGKWNHMMDQTHIGYTYWQEPPRNAMPRVDVIQVPQPAEMGVTFEGQLPPGPPGPGGPRAPALPEFDVFQRQVAFIDVYNRGQEPFEFTAQSAEPWLTVQPAGGRVLTEQRLAVSVDWSRAPAGRNRVPITISGPEGRRVVIQAPVFNPASPRAEEIRGFVEGNGYVAMEAEHFTAAITSPTIQWLRIPGLGRTLSGVTVMPSTAPSVVPAGASPHLEYRAFLFDSGEVRVRTHVSPSLNTAGRKEGLRFAVSFDDEAPQVVDVVADSSLQAWERSVGDNIRVLTTRHRLATPGTHVLKFWMVDPGVVLQKLVIEARDLPPSYLGPPARPPR
jgi:hypothetical protein